ncbi:cyclic nucleotide-binding domain-containing protein [Halobacteriovorax sp. JY17]|uniref:Crp/Fnr family transcriptional regulator n=1 Tax=Halobacteriovorax sp. JY17 TaxID=2014617 RepID=UPI0025C2365D|nr:cyclic nucleotide-binding domain-containing protein [Halobacteriovorax sp. JY17]
MSADIIELQAGEYLIREGEESAQMYYLQSGSMAVYKVKGGAEHQIGTIYSGELVGEMSFLDKEPRSASVKAISEAKLLVIPVEKFEKYFNDQPSWYRALIHTLLERLRKANTRIRV